jgi:hypothetical protein
MEIKIKTAYKCLIKISLIEIQSKKWFVGYIEFLQGIERCSSEERSGRAW